MHHKQLTAAQTFDVARSIAVKYFPYYAIALYSLIPCETLKEPTAAVTERWVCFYNPDFTRKQGPKFFAAILVHEINHLLREHMKRFRKRMLLGKLSRIAGKPIGDFEQAMAKLWNLAADAEINGEHPAQLPLPAGCIMPATFGLPKGKTAEHYFNLLLQQQEQEPEGEPESGGSEDGDSEDGDQDDGGSGGEQDDGGSGDEQDDGGSGDEQDDGGSGADQDDGGSGADQDDGGSSGGSGDGQGEPQDDGPAHGSCGSCAGHRKPSEPLDGKLGKEGRSDAEVERIRDQVAEAAIEHEKEYGTGVGAGLLWWAKERLKPPTIRWEQQLASLTRQAVAYQEGMVDYRDDILSPEQSVIGYGPDVPLIPALVAPVPEVMFLVDRSGSMSGRDLTEVAQEVPGVLRGLQTPLHFGSFDTQMQEIKKVSTVKEALKLFTGGGGTDFRPIFTALQNMKANRPSVLIIGTDGCGPAPAEPPKGVSVIWLLVGKYATKPTCSTGPVRWGKFIFTNPELRAEHIAAAA